jgi:tight adherence protein C
MLVPPFLAATSILAAAAALRQRRDRRVATLVRGLAGESKQSSGPGRRLLVRAAKRTPAFLVRPGERLSRLVVLAGTTWSAPEIAALKPVLVLGCAVPLALIAPGFGPALAMTAVGAAAASRVPDFVLARRARSRQGDIERRVPDLVELLVATTEAGLAPAVAFRRSAEVLVGPLGDELRLAVDEIDLGLPWREAMDRLVGRTDVPSLARLVSTLARSNRLGTSVRATLRSVADDLRAERRARAEEAARRAPVKMLFPLVFLILPAFLLLTVGPVVLATVHSLRSG